MKSECDDFRNRIEAFLDRSLKNQAKKAFLAHAAQCETCCQALTKEQELVELLINVPHPACPDRVIHRILAETVEKEAKIKAHAHIHRIYWRTALVGGVAMAFLLLIVLRVCGPASTATANPKYWGR